MLTMLFYHNLNANLFLSKIFLNPDFNLGLFFVDSVVLFSCDCKNKKWGWKYIIFNYKIKIEKVKEHLT